MASRTTPPSGTTTDDAVHILTDTDRGLLCGTPLVAGLNVTRIYGPQPDPGSGCWTCMQKRHEYVSEVAP